MLLNHESLVRSANAIGPLPKSVAQLNILLANDDFDFDDVVRAIELDTTLTGRLFRLANSAVYAGTPVSTVKNAVIRLGGGTVKSVAIAAKARPKIDLDLSCFGLSPDSYWRHCVAVLSFAEELIAYRPKLFSPDMATAALLHDFGKLVLAAHLTPKHVDALWRQNDPATPRVDHEMRVLGVTHAEVSAVVAQSWHLPEDLVSALQYHHNPSGRNSPTCHGLTIANHLAMRLESRQMHYDREEDVRSTSLQVIDCNEEDENILFERGQERLAQIFDAYA